MQTKLSSFCGKAIQAGVLAALIIAPVYYNIISLHPFDPAKAAMLQSIALFMLAAWVVKIIEERAPAARDLGRLQTIDISFGFLDQPVVVAGLLVAGACLLSALLSVDHRISLWGGFYRRQGLLTLLSYTVIFLAGATTLRTREGQERAATVAVLASLPVTFYALVQHLGLDFLPWGEEIEQRAIAMMGNAIFLGAFLILAIPLVTARLGQAVGALRRPGRPRLWGLVLAWLYGLLLIAQVGAIVFTQSKGALAGLLAGLFFFGFLWAAARGYRTLFIVALLAAALAALVVLYIILPATSLGTLQDLPMLSRLTGALQSRSFLSRTLIWDSVTRMITGQPGRLLVGYGPSTMDVALQRYYTPALLKKRSATTVLDRAHSDLLDAAATAGLLGLAAYLLLFWALFHQVLRHLGLLTSRQEGRILSGLWFGLGLAAALGARLADGSWRFSGLALGLGAVGGLVLYVTYRGLPGGRPGLAGAESRLSLLPIGLAAGVLAHFVGGQFGIATPADRTYFWVFAALVAGLATPGAAPVEAEVGVSALSAPVDSERRSGRGRSTGSPARFRQAEPSGSGGASGHGTGVIGGLVGGFILMTLLNDFIWRKDRLEPSPVMLGLLGAVWLAGALMFLGEDFITSAGSRPRSWSREVAGYALASLPLPLIFLPLHIRFIGPGRIPQEQPVVYLVMLLVMILLLAVVLKRPEQDVDAAWRPDWAALYGLVVVAVAVVMIVVSVTPLRASAFDKLGWSAAQDPGRVNLAVSMYQRAIELAPQWEQLYLRAGALLQGEAERLPAGTQQDAYYQASLQELEAALQLRPGNAVHWINLGHFYVRRGNATSEPVSRRERLKRALEYYEHAATLRPASADLYREWGEVYAVLGRRDAALQKFTYAVTLDPDYVGGYRSLAQLYEIEEDWAGAVRAYRELVRLEPASVDTSRALARACWRAGDLQSALAVYLQVLEREPRDYAAHRELIDLYQALGRPQTALAEARIARELAPPQDQAALDDIITRLEPGE